MELDKAVKELEELSKLITTEERVNGLMAANRFRLNDRPSEFEMSDLSTILMNKNALTARICSGVEDIHSMISNILGELSLYYTVSEEYDKLTESKKFDDIISYDNVKMFFIYNNFNSTDAVVTKIIDTHIDRLLRDIVVGQCHSVVKSYSDKILYNLLTSIENLHTAAYSNKIVAMVRDAMNSECDTDDIKILIENVLQHHNCLTIDDVEELKRIKQSYRVLEELNS